MSFAMPNPRAPRWIPALWLVGGILLLVSFALPWYDTIGFGYEDVLSGVALLHWLPWLALLAGLGLLFGILGALGLDRGRLDSRLANTGSTRLAIALLSLAAFALPVLTALLFPVAGSGYQVAFWNVAGLGWGVAVVGVTLILMGGLLFPLAPKGRPSGAA